MAKAPNPRATPNAPAEKARQQGRAITVRGVEAIFREADYGARDDAMVRRATRDALGEPLTIQGALNQLREGAVGLDSVCLLWWLARRKAGDTEETYGDALDAFPGYGEIYDPDAAPDLLKVEEIDGDHPEDGSGEG